MGGRWGFAFLRNCPLSWLGEILLFSTVSTERQMPGVCYHKMWTIADLMTLPKINSKVRVPVIQGWRNDSRGGGGGTRTWGPSRKRVPKCLKGPKTTYKNIAIAEKQSKRSKNGPFCFILGPPGPTQEMELMGPGGEGPSRFLRFPQSCRHSCPTLPYSEKVPIPTYSLW